MTTRLPVLGARSVGGRAAVVSGAERVAVTQPLLCVASTSAAALRFACRLIEELSTRGCEVCVLLCEPTAAAPATLQALRNAGARDVVEIDAERLPRSALDALAAQPQQAFVVGIGAELCDHLQPLLTTTIGNKPSTIRHAAELELPLGSEAVASAIGAWLAAHWLERAHTPA